MLTERTYTAGLYLRLSKDDDGRNESVSIGTQRDILTDYCNEHGFVIYKVYIDDGYSGLNFDRPRFQEMLDDIELGRINMVLTKDLSRLGRDYIMTGYYSEIYFPSKGIRYIALADDVDTLKGHNAIAPFKNILNDMYAQDISKKVKNAKHQRANQGRSPNQHLKTLPFFAPNPASGISWNERQMPLKIFRRLILCVTITVSAVVIFAGSSS